MDYLRENTFEQVNAEWLTRFLALVSVATILPFFIHSQLITGTIINATLILALFLTGLRSALLISFLPSTIALGSGLLPLVLAPAIPFIIASNIIFVLVIDLMYKKLQSKRNAHWLIFLSASGLKFIFLLFTVNFLAAFFIEANLVLVIGKMMGYLQLLTALAGSFIAYLFLRIYIFKKYV